jgi:hypothetical protein
MHVIAAKAVALKEALDPKFKDYQKQVPVNFRTRGGRSLDCLRRDGLPHVPDRSPIKKK